MSISNTQNRISTLVHPNYTASVQDWFKWRITYEGGRRFINQYLHKFSAREDDADFRLRKSVTYCPAFAKEGINDVKNAIYQRMADIARSGGSDAYQLAISGMDGGVDNKGNSLTSFLGSEILPELLTMRRVGIYVDMPQIDGNTRFDTLDVRPYLYVYPAESIQCWFGEDDNATGYDAVLLRDTIFQYDEETGFPIGQTERYRRLWKVMVDGQPMVKVVLYNADGEENETKLLNLSRLPFIPLTIQHSLLEDIADYQIALMNLASSDMAYALKSNFPFYVEQFDYRGQGSPYLRQETEGDEGTALEANSADDRNIKVGVSAGRAYPINTNQPAFIHPSPEPLRASMEKQEQLKKEIRLLLHLAVSNLSTAGRASVEAKMVDERSLENGLSNIGMVLEKAEREIAQVWAMYEGVDNVATVQYPQTYNLRSESDRMTEAEKLDDLKDAIPSKTYQKEVCKKLAYIMLGDQIENETLEKIFSEIDKASNAVSDPDIIAKDVENGLVDPETASLLRGYPEGTAAKAEAAHAKRAAAIVEAQTSQAQMTDGGARGVGTLDTNPQKSGKTEKKVSRGTTLDTQVADKTRGGGK